MASGNEGMMMKDVVVNALFQSIPPLSNVLLVVGLLLFSMIFGILRVSLSGAPPALRWARCRTRRMRVRSGAQRPVEVSLGSPGTSRRRPVPNRAALGARQPASEVEAGGGHAARRSGGPAPRG